MDRETITRIKKFTADRDWGQFHSPGNLAKSISIESGELLELFQWSDNTVDIDKVRDELADILVYCCLLANKFNLDITEIIHTKIDKNEIKYPISKAKGKSTKYDKL